MHKYPALSSLSSLARVIGWIAVAVAGIMALIGLVEISSGLNQNNNNPFAVYSGVVLLSTGGSLFILGLILVLIGEVIHVFIDIEANTAETANLLRSHGKAAGGNDIGQMPKETGVASEFRPSPVSATKGIITDLTNINTWKISRNELLTLGSIDTVRRAAAAGFTIEYYPEANVIFTKQGKSSMCYSNADIMKFSQKMAD
jgi:hypothetical protein